MVRTNIRKRNIGSAGKVLSKTETTNSTRRNSESRKMGRRKPPLVR